MIQQDYLVYLENLVNPVKLFHQTLFLLSRGTLL